MIFLTVKYKCRFGEQYLKNNVITLILAVSNIFNCYCCSVTKSCPTLHNPMDYSMSGFPVHHRLLEFAQVSVIESVTPSNHLILCHPLLLLSSVFRSIRVFPISQLLALGGQSIEGSTSASVLPMNI